MVEIKAIDTEYRGFLFRSRLEARWAYYFDAIGTPWLYESEGYELDGVRYLPDFYLPELGVFVEVKPDTPRRDSPEMAKAIALAKASDKPVLISSGDPGGSMPLHALMYSPDYGEDGHWYLSSASLGNCPDCERTVFTEWNRAHFGTPDYCEHLNEASRLPASCELAAKEAGRLARQSRYEFGATPSGARVRLPARFYRAHMPVSVYLAGKIPTGTWGCRTSQPGKSPCRCKDERQCSGYSWRDRIFPNYEQVKEPFRGDSGLKVDGYVYAGPSFEGSGHGCYDHETVSRCFSELYNCDAIFAWIHRPDVHGTMAELGYAKAYNKRIYVGFDVSRYRTLPETLKFARDISNEWIACTDPRTAWRAFQRWYKG